MENIFERELNIRTSGFQMGYPKQSHYHRYEPTPYEALEQLFETYSLPKHPAVVDFGCGKGRVPIYMHACRQAEAVGVEMDVKFFVEAEHNKEMYWQVATRKHKQLQFWHMLAEHYIIRKQDNVFFFFNPFSIQIFRKVVVNILSSFEEYPREMHILLYYPTPDYLFYLQFETPFEFEQEISLLGHHNENERICVYKLSY